MSSSDEQAPAPAPAPAAFEGEKWSAEAQPRRKGNVEEWSKNQAKRRRDSGQEYVAVKSKVLKAAARVGEPCNCPKSCFDAVGAHHVQQMFDEYWGLASHNSQSSYLASRVTRKDVARRYAGPDSKRSVTYEYSVVADSKDVVICKKAFYSIHGISKKRVENVVAKVGTTGIAPVDKRGKASSSNRTPDEVEQLVKEHILSLPTCSSHYSRAKSRDKVYLPPGYTHHHCYDLYKLTCAEDQVAADKIVSFSAYSRQFSTYNIGSNPPMIDTCSTCDRIKREEEVAKAEKDDRKQSALDTERRLHNIMAKVARNIMNAYGQDNDPTLCAVAVDLQQTLVTPRLTTNVAYYKRKMWTYNLSIHNLKESDKANLYVWNEAIAKRGSSDVGSCLMHCIANSVPAECDKLIIFSDNCSGQNKNINLSLLLLRYIHSGRFKLIRQYYLMSGHSYLPCDQDFGILERYFVGHEIYTTAHYTQMMREARRENPFNVIEMDRDGFYDLDPLQQAMTKTHLTKAGFKDARVLLYSADFMQGLQICSSYSEEAFNAPTQVKLQKGKGAAYQLSKFDLSTIDLPLKYPNGVKLKSDKLEDLNYLLRFIPIGYKTWYEDLFATQGLLAAEDAPDEANPDPDDVLDW